MRLLFAIVCAFAVLLAACTAQKSNPTSDGKSSPTTAPGSATAPAAKSDENGFLNDVYGPSGEGGHRFMAQSPGFLVNKGYEVCDKITRGWGWDYIKANLRDPSLYDEDVEPIAASAAIHLCGMTQDQLHEYINTHVATW
jgi:hypothetical protein